MTTRTASCSCGQLKAECAGEPVRISICHCLACQKRTGSAISTNARFPRDAVKVLGASKTFQRLGDSSKQVTFHFCPDCGSTVYWKLDNFPDVIAVAVGNFADPSFPRPRVSVYETHRHEWLPVEAVNGLEHHD